MTELFDLEPGWMWRCRLCSTSSDRGRTWGDEQDAAEDADNHERVYHQPYDFDWADELKYAREERIR